MTYVFHFEAVVILLDERAGPGAVQGVKVRVLSRQVLFRMVQNLQFLGGLLRRHLAQLAAE